MLGQGKLDTPFVQPFDGRKTTIRQDAREVRCSPTGELLGATLSDNGHIIIAMFFDFPNTPSGSSVADYDRQPQPGKISEHHGVSVQDEAEYLPWCESRAANGYNSGMGEIFRRVAMISQIDLDTAMAAPTVDLKTEL